MLCERTGNIVVEEIKTSKSPTGRTVLMVRQEKYENINTM